MIPTLLAALVLRFLVPPVAGPGFPGWIAWLASRATVPFGVGLFFLFSLLARYWRFRIPGGRYASSLPAHLVADETDGGRLAEWAKWAELYDISTSRRMQRRLLLSLDDREMASVDRSRSDLASALEHGDFPAARTAAGALEKVAARALSSRRRRGAIGVAGAAAAAAATALVLRAQVIEPYRVLSASMLPTLEPMDYVAANHLAYRSAFGGHEAGIAGRLPQRGDVVVFRSREVPFGPAGGPEFLVKRVIGLPGDRISMRAGVPVINDEAVPFCDAGPYLYTGLAGDGGALRGRIRVEFLGGRAYLTLHAASAPFEGTYDVQPGEVFVLGDNRSNSLDSRAFRQGHGGGVPIAAIDGRAQWFLIGMHRSAGVDLGRLLRPVDTLERSIHLEGLDAQSIEAAVNRCLTTRSQASRAPDPAPPAIANGAKGGGS